MFGFEAKLFQELREENKLTIFAQGLPIQSVVCALISLYDIPENLVLIIGATENDKEFLMQRICKISPSNSITSITSKVNAKERNLVYSRGGIHFVTSRLLIIDILKENIPLEALGGIIVFNAEKLIGMCAESFIVSEVHKKCKNGFIKALSNCPNAFGLSMNSLMHCLSNLRLRSVSLYPRYHKMFIEGMRLVNSKNLSVNEIEVDFDKLTKSCFSSLLDVFTACVIELEKLLKNQEKIPINDLLSRESKNIFHTLGLKYPLIAAKRKFIVLAKDLLFIRQLMFDLLRDDSYLFYIKIREILDKREDFKTESGWVFLDSFTKLFSYSKARLTSTLDSSNKQYWDPKVSSKWTCLHQLLSEYKNELKSNNCEAKICLVFANKASHSQFIVLAENEADEDYFDIYTNSQKYLDISSKFNKQEEKTPGLTFKSVIEDIDFHLAINSPKNHNHLMQKFEEIEPSHIIIFEPSLIQVRNVESYSLKSTHHVELNMIFFKDSIETINYKQEIAREKDTFNTLIREKSSLVLPQDFSIYSMTNDQHLPNQFDYEVNFGNQAKSKKNDKPEAIIVDMREFNCELPIFLHQKNYKIEPITLEVGDYILTDEVCIERKTIPDLIGSINSGRLYNQCVAISHFYKSPILLIEMQSENNPRLGINCNKQDRRLITNHLVLIAMHFNEINIIWSPSYYFTVDIFSSLKKQKNEPELSDCVLSSEGNEDMLVYFLKLSSMKLMTKLPGMDSRSINYASYKNLSLLDIVDNDLSELCTISGNSQKGKNLFDFINKDFSV
ncbi:MAG: DNA repair endonuclease XPF [Marteilia pararefringens]